jgi:FkbM family methyltransferase
MMSTIPCQVSSGTFGCEIQLPADLIYRLAIEQWVRRRGDEELLLTHDLGPTSTVVEVGGFVGIWSGALYDRYAPTMHILEPGSEFFAHLAARFAGEPRVHLYPIGLGHPGTAQLMLDGVASSLVRRSSTASEQILLKSFDVFVEENGIGTIDLLQINIEGGEYELLDQILGSRFLRNIRKLQVQFHLNRADATTRREHLRRELRRTHNELFNYPFVWESWALRTDPP